MGRHIHIEKAFLYALVLAIAELRKFIDKSRTKQPERLMWCIIYTSMASDVNAFVGREGRLYTYTGVGLSALLVSDEQGNAKALTSGTSDRIGSTFSCIYTDN